MSSEMQHEDGAYALNPDDLALTDIIDITEIDFNDEERWLLQDNHMYAEADVSDIRIWLQPTSPNSDDTTSDCIDNANKKLIDSRTWTKPKKRFSRLNFESIKEVGSSTPPLQSMKNDVWQIDNLELSNNELVNQQLEMKLNKNSEEYIPPMLRLSLSGSSKITQTTGHESLEAFLNMSQSNGVDSFINMEAPEFNENVFAATTGPSIMSTSSLSSIYTHDDNDQSMNQKIGMADSQILTDSMMHTSIFNDVSDVNFDDTFSQDNVNISVIENPNYSTDVFDKPTIDNNDTFNLSIKLNKPDTIKNIDTTFTSNEMPDASNEKSYIVNQTFDSDPPGTNYSSYIVIKETETADDKDIDCLDIVNEENTEVRLNETFDADSSSSHESVNSTLTLSPRHSENSNKTSIDSVELLESLNTTYSTNENESPTPIKLEHKINKTFQTSSNSPKTINTTFKAPLSLNNQQVNSINSTFVAETPLMNETYDENVPSIPLPTNRYQTYRRNPMEIKKKNPQQSDTTNDKDFVVPNPSTILSNYQTYRKNPSAISRIKSTNIISTDESCRVGSGQAKSLENLMRIKSNIQIPKKLYAPKDFSRLPQNLQKSNPNLTSSNAFKITTNPTRVPNFGFNRPRQINNGDPSLTKKLYSIAKLSKCDSEEILDGPTGNSEYIKTRGSTESIESTQSAHSAPDLDERLSICSNNSHNSYSQCAVNINELNEIVQRQEESLKHEPNADKRVLENTWVSDETNLPSPILKDSQILSSRGSSPGSTGSAVKTSSPIFSPIGSLQSLNTNTEKHLIEDKVSIKRTESEEPKKLMMPTKPLKTSEFKSGLRQPINRGINSVSGIPRPASRIPAPRFSRTNVKSHMEIKKNIL